MKNLFLKTSLILIILLLAIFTIPFGKKSVDNEVVFWTLQMNDFAPYMNKVISEFEAQNPDVKIKWIDVPFSEGEKRTLASVLSDNPPDLINLNPDFTALLAQRGALYQIDEQYTKQYNQSIINSLKTNGKLYSLPWYATSAVTIYNKDLLAKSGAKMPATYKDLAQIAPQIKQKTGAYVFELFKNLYEKDLIPKESITQTHREALEKYMAEKIVFFQAGANFLTMIKENAPSTYANTDVAPQIVGELGQNDFSLMNFVIPTRAKHKNEALKFALFLTNSENQLAMAKLTNILAVNEETLQNEFYTKYDEKDLMSKARIISAKQLNKIEPTFMPARNQKEINLLVNEAVQQILLNKATTKNILDNLSDKMKELSE